MLVQIDPIPGFMMLAANQYHFPLPVWLGTQGPGRIFHIYICPAGEFFFRFYPYDIGFICIDAAKIQPPAVKKGIVGGNHDPVCGNRMPISGDDLTAVFINIDCRSVLINSTAGPWYFFRQHLQIF